MNKTIWALAFVVLCSGFVFAEVNPAYVDEINTSKWTNGATAGTIVTEGGNVTAANLTVNASTEKWAGAFGEIDGTLVLAQDGETSFLYNWTFTDPDGGEVCVTTNSTPTWTTGLAALTAIAQVDQAFGFDTGDTDSASSTMGGAANFDIAGFSGSLDTLTDNAGWIVGVLGLSGASSNTTDTLAFCVNISANTANYQGGTSDYELMMPTDDAADATETYYFFVELI